jgi:drug/metabolite transporter (DMT)-like permease
MTKQPLVYLSLIITIILWASAFVGIKAALDGYTPIQLSVWRFIIASLTLLLISFFKKIDRIILKDLPRFFFIGFTGITIYNLALNYGELNVTVSAASFIINTVPMLTLLLSIIFLKEKISSKAYLGTIISLFGVGLICFAEGGALILLAAFSQSVFFLLQKPLLKKYSPLSLICYSVWIGTFCLLPFLLLENTENLKTASIYNHLSVLYLGVFPGSIGYLTWTYVLSKMNVQSATVFLYIIPIITIIIGAIWIKEIPTTSTIIGGIITICGVLIFNLKK